MDIYTIKKEKKRWITLSKEKCQSLVKNDRYRQFGENVSLFKNGKFIGHISSNGMFWDKSVSVKK